MKLSIIMKESAS